MKFISIQDIAKQLNISESFVNKEIAQVAAELSKTTNIRYLVYNQGEGSTKVLAVTPEDIDFISSGYKKRSFLDLLNNFKLPANDLLWLLKELHQKNVFNKAIHDYYVEAKNKPSIRVWFEPNEIVIGQKSILNIEITSPTEVQEPKINIEASQGLEPEEKSKLPNKLFQGKFMEKYGFDANVFGNQKVAVGLEGVVDGAFFVKEPVFAELTVQPLQPELVISQTQSVYETVHLGVFRLTLDITNRGPGTSQNVELKGFENHLEFEVLEPTKIGNIPSHGSVKYKIALKPKKSGAFSFTDLTVQFEDLSGKPYTTLIPEFEIQVTTPQPKLRVEFAYPDNLAPNRVFPLTLRITNIGDGEARNITFTLPIDHSIIQSGIVDCNIPKLKPEQTEELTIKLLAPEKTALEVPDLAIKFDDGEDNTNLQKVFGLAIPIASKKSSAKQVVDHTSVRWPFVLNARIGGQYDIVEEIGEGGFAKVYRVRRLKFNEEWALKALKAEYVTIPSFEEQFVEEARVSQRLREDHIVGVQYVDVQTMEDIEFPYIIMEYIKGGTLKERLREPQDLMTCAEIMKDMCSALLYAHQQGIIHFDLKPSNIFYDDYKKLWKLGDFGLAKPITASSNVSPRGSLPYMAPEVKQGKGTSKSDIYSLGRVCAEILTGTPDGDIARADKNYPRESKPKVKEFAAVIEKMLNVNPVERPTIVEVQKVFCKSATWSSNEKRSVI
jgi:hypothetical protein